MPAKEYLSLVIPKLGKLIKLVHFSDNDGTMAYHYPLGKGTIDFKAVIRSLRRAGFDGGHRHRYFRGKGHRRRSRPGQENRPGIDRRRQRMNIGLSSFLFVYSTLGDAIRKTAEAGYDAIDIWGGRPHAYRKDLAPDEILQVNALLGQHHLGVASFIPAQFRYPTCLCSCNETIRQDSVAYILDAIETAVALRAPVVSVCPGHTIHGQPQRDAWGKLEESLEVICQRAGQRGLLIALEPADAYETDLMNTVTEAMTMVEELDFPNLGIVLNSGHVNLTQEILCASHPGRRNALISRPCQR